MSHEGLLKIIIEGDGSSSKTPFRFHSRSQKTTYKKQKTLLCTKLKPIFRFSKLEIVVNIEDNQY